MVIAVVLHLLLLQPHLEVAKSTSSGKRLAVLHPSNGKLMNERRREDDKKRKRQQAKAQEEVEEVEHVAL